MDFPWRRKREELNAEIESHIQMAIRDRIERGESARQAQAAARREFGNVGLVKEVTREIWGWNSLERFTQDVRYGLRSLRKNPGFAIVAILTLALGIGANTALFSVVNGVLLNPLPFHDPGRLVIFFGKTANFNKSTFSYLNFLDWQKQNRSFTAIGAFRPASFNLTGSGEPVHVRGERISAALFPSFGISPVLGLNFLPEEDRRSAAPVAMIGAGFWKRKFGASPDIIGRQITLDGIAYTIVGVIPAEFHFTNHGERVNADIYTPIGQWDNPDFHDRKIALGIVAIGRLKPGVTLEQAQSDMNGITENLARAYPEADKGTGVGLYPLREEMTGGIQPVLLLLFGAVGFVLLIACVNIANLLLARSAGRAREFAIRAALGAGRGRIIRQLLTESILLAVAGGALGLLIAAWGLQTALHTLPATLPRVDDVSLDSHVLIFTIVVTLLAGVLFGLAPALKTSRPNLQETLKESARGVSGARQRTQGIFVMVEMALALILLTGAGLMIRSFIQLWGTNPGFDSHNVLTFELSLPPSMHAASPDAIRSAFRQVKEKLAAAPGIQAVSLMGGSLPMTGDWEDQFWLEGKPKPATTHEMESALFYAVEPEYLQVMGVPLRSGRFFTAQDDEHSKFVIVIDEAFARKYFPQQNPLGKQVNFEDGEVGEIIGVVGHVNQWGLGAEDQFILQAQFYFPFMQFGDKSILREAHSVDVVIRAGAGPLRGIWLGSRRNVTDEQPASGLRRPNHGPDRCGFPRRSPLRHDSARRVRRARTGPFGRGNLWCDFLPGRAAHPRNRNPPRVGSTTKRCAAAGPWRRREDGPDRRGHRHPGRARPHPPDRRPALRSQPHRSRNVRGRNHHSALRGPASLLHSRPPRHAGRSNGFPPLRVAVVAQPLLAACFSAHFVQYFGNSTQPGKSGSATRIAIGNYI